MADSSRHSAVIAGASGLVGSHLLTKLLEDDRYESVTALVRRELSRSHPKLVQRVVDFDHIDEQAGIAPGVDLFCCLGTTIRTAGSQEAFRLVDYTYVVELAKAAASGGADQFLTVSSIGADARSRIFYSRVKGEVEDAIRSLPLKAVHIFRPSLLTGERRERRVGERIMMAVFGALRFAMVGPLRLYRPIRAEDVALAMLRVAHSGLSGVHIYPSDRIQSIADGEPGE